jgi:hypothetical protein
VTTRTKTSLLGFELSTTKTGDLKAKLDLSDGTQVKMPPAMLAAFVNSVTEFVIESERQDAELEAAVAQKH